jgi:hypothetical protein
MSSMRSRRGFGAGPLGLLRLNIKDIHCFSCMVGFIGCYVDGICCNTILTPIL